MRAPCLGLAMATDNLRCHESDSRSRRSISSGSRRIGHLMCARSTESNERSATARNDAIRAVVAAHALQGDRRGANLGMTQRGRIEAARVVILLNTDSIDNSAGVNTSDVESLKIALSCRCTTAVLTWPDAPCAARQHDRPKSPPSCCSTTTRMTLAISLTNTRVSITSIPHRLISDAEKRPMSCTRAVHSLPTQRYPPNAPPQAIPAARGPEIAVCLAYYQFSAPRRRSARLQRRTRRSLSRSRASPLHNPACSVTTRFSDAGAASAVAAHIISTGLRTSLINRCGPHPVVRSPTRPARSSTVRAAFASVRAAISRPR